MQVCPLCGAACPGGHFHALDGPGSHHLCGAEHSCVEPGSRQPHTCDEDAHPGGCSIEGEIEKVLKVFQGRRDVFQYEYVTRQNMRRKACTVKIPPWKLRHDGPCGCGRAAEEHYCGAPCPQCLYRCALGFGMLAYASDRRHH